ncbi:Asp-tRNA(Asn)/Glu-tRNA(Gln) amidotransferase subunit GatC [Desulfobaculum bizertense]|uniref:Aspartyl/glutamyl-tRNA(Asn/Gln) amidotransferase subunit C n=1 Tax=Desulfobaculum bizertense DSM 18034 TaxID=1121442 RepID=A0A1T4WG74_9BACT|nr:Asp-tRNA(Asn)/Glu-tRNA(Gln) amidotransferase subunit GatC [Desulfobaculum bizertense]UIJ36629.1 Asp-tRNA(Asn)/Glu-tRNA(Gln) amidotransferase subunit GatC [Desulfobaculum bizertense]SKA76290.1 aspartyl/glutamyl-tRNA(Asn/Gln) amidotransferase subunit C [Desulfobaculum bizertense DSM 18034]
MKITPEQVAKVARLARLHLSEDEQAQFSGQLGNILEYMDELGQADTEGIEPLYSPIENMSCLRDDEVRESSNRDDVMANAPESDGKYFIVPRIV